MRARYLMAAALFAATAAGFTGCGSGSPTTADKKGTKIDVETPGTDIKIRSKEGSGTTVDVKKKDKDGQ
ncbi:MAG: hypothetical protein K2X87_31000 [Gemmataceae bacterium]|nr:hypothetical protein [Gemmataceae bacterium]